MVVIITWGKDEKSRWKNTTGQVEDPALYAKQVPRLKQERLSGQEISFLDSSKSAWWAAGLAIIGAKT